MKIGVYDGSSGKDLDKLVERICVKNEVVQLNKYLRTRRRKYPEIVVVNPSFSSDKIGYAEPIAERAKEHEKTQFYVFVFVGSGEAELRKQCSRIENVSYIPFFRDGIHFLEKMISWR
ncbi:hypothetical protein J4402_05655 [Candidatus Pacearchaeota archaeon]|nr:hypothetical protein [Candidatus Pacearchaeota archaeon]